MTKEDSIKLASKQIQELLATNPTISELKEGLGGILEQLSQPKPTELIKGTYDALDELTIRKEPTGEKCVCGGFIKGGECRRCGFDATEIDIY